MNFRRVELEKLLKDEEDKMKSANEKTLREMKERLKKEVENAKLDMLDVSRYKL